MTFEVGKKYVPINTKGSVIFKCVYAGDSIAILKSIDGAVETAEFHNDVKFYDEYIEPVIEKTQFHIYRDRTKSCFIVDKNFVNYSNTNPFWKNVGTLEIEYDVTADKATLKVI